MFDRRARFLPVRYLLAAVAAALIGVAGCSGGSRSSSGNMTGVTVPNGTAALSAPELRQALLTRINGVAPVTRADAGSYASLPEVRAAAAQMKGVTVTPKACLRATVLQGADLDTGALGGVPAAVVNFRVGSNGVSEVLAAASDTVTVAALGQPIPAACSRYTASAGGQTFQYAVRQDWLNGIGVRPARVLNIATVANNEKGNVWSVLYQGNGFVGAVTVVGPNASEAAVSELGKQAYAYAAKALAPR